MMLTDHYTRKVVEELESAGFAALRTDGSHTVWVSENGKVHVNVPGDRRTVSPGGYRKMLEAIEEAGV